jgi:hypothetical protein
MVGTRSATMGMTIGTGLRRGLSSRLADWIQERVSNDKEQVLDRITLSEDALRGREIGPDRILRVSDPSPLRWPRLM